MNCRGCKCDSCVRSSELMPWDRTDSEMAILSSEEFCFTCDECRHWGGDWNKKSQRREECPNYWEAAKRQESRLRAEGNMEVTRTQAMKKMLGLRLIKGGASKKEEKL